MEVKEIQFYEDTLLGVMDEDGQVWLAVKKTCLDLGLSEGQARKQVENIQKEKLLKSNCRSLAIVQKEGNRDVSRDQIFIKEQVVTLWLAKITLTDRMEEEQPEAYNKLIRYQMEAQKVLHEHFMGTEEKKQEFYDKMGISGQIAKLQDIVKVQGVQINNMESMIEKQLEIFEQTKTRLDKVMSNMTLTTVQQNKIHRLAKDRVGFLLGGAHSQEYKDNSRMYFINLWNGLKARFECGSHWQDLNPAAYDGAVKYVQKWSYSE